MACREGRESNAVTGISVRELSSNHRCLRERTPLKAQAGTSDSRLASRRLWDEIITKSKNSVCLCACVSMLVRVSEVVCCGIETLWLTGRLL